MQGLFSFFHNCHLYFYEVLFFTRLFNKREWLWPWVPSATKETNTESVWKVP